LHDRANLSNINAVMLHTLASLVGAQLKLTADAFDSVFTRQATIQDARYLDFVNEKTGERSSCFCVKFEEWPAWLQCNATQRAAFKKLVKAEHLPKRSSEWAGAKITLGLRAFRNPMTKGLVLKPIPVHPDLQERTA
jgi:hypothetical protein